MSSLENAEEARGVHSWTGSDIGAVRSTNQDAVAGFDDLGLFLLADGMGGGVRGDLASRTAIEAAGNFVRAAEPASRLSPACLVAAVEAAEAVRRAFSRAAAFVDGLAVGATVSVGVASDAEVDTDLSGLFRRADAALYIAKRAGRDQVALLESDDDQVLPGSTVRTSPNRLRQSRVLRRPVRIV